MFYLYLDGELISYCEDFSEVDSICKDELFKWCFKPNNIHEIQVKFFDDLLKHHHAVSRIQISHDEYMYFEVWYG